MTQNVSQYAHLTFVSLLKAYQQENPKESVHVWMVEGLTTAFRKPTLKGVALTRIKKLIRDVILEDPTWLLFNVLHNTPFTGRLMYLAQGAEPPAPKSKAPSCGSEWFIDTLASFFEWYGQPPNEFNLARVHKLLANWAEQYTILVGQKPDHSVYMSRFKEAFEPINRHYGSRIRISYQRKAPKPEQLSLALPDPKDAHLVIEPIDDGPLPVEEMPIIDSAPVEYTLLSIDQQPDYQASLAKACDNISSVSIVKKKGQVLAPDEYDIFLGQTKLLDLLVNGPIELDRQQDENGEFYDWRDYAPIFTKWPMVGIRGNYLIFCSVNHHDEEGRMVHLGGQIQIEGGKPISQRSLDNILHIQAVTNPKPHCYVNRIKLQPGITGKCWINTEGFRDMEGSHKWFVVTRRDDPKPVPGKIALGMNPEYVLWLVPEFVHLMHVAELKKVQSAVMIRLP